MRGRPAIEHLEQSGLYNSLSAAVTAARYGVAERKSGGYEAANAKQNYRIAFKPEGVEVNGSGRRGWRMGISQCPPAVACQGAAAMAASKL